MVSDVMDDVITPTITPTIKNNEVELLIIASKH